MTYVLSYSFLISLNGWYVEPLIGLDLIGLVLTGLDLIGLVLKGYHPTNPFTILVPHDQEIGEFYEVQERRTTDFEAPKL